MLIALASFALAGCPFDVPEFHGSAVIDVPGSPSRSVAVDAKGAAGVHVQGALVSEGYLDIAIEDETVRVAGTTKSAVLSPVSPVRIGEGLTAPGGRPVELEAEAGGWVATAMAPRGYTAFTPVGGPVTCENLALVDVGTAADPPGEHRRVGPGLFPVSSVPGGAPVGRFHCGDPGCAPVWVDQVEGDLSHVRSAVAGAQLEGWIATAALEADPDVPKTPPVPDPPPLRGLRCGAGPLSINGSEPRVIGQLRDGAAVLAGTSAEGWTQVVLPEATWLKGALLLPDAAIAACRPDPAVVRVPEPGPGSILGALDRSLIDEVIKRSMNQIRYCYQRVLTRQPSLGGKVVIRFVIERDGRVSGAATRSTTMNDTEVETCIEGRFLKMQFPEPKGGGVVIVSYPFVFSPG